MIRQKVQTYIRNHELLTPGKPIVVGVSGGTDSVVLLHILVSLGYDCVIAHCNFHLRMEESTRDEEFVRQLAGNLGICFEKIDFQTVDFAKQNGISIEMAARELRYAWFEKLRGHYGAQAVAVAHHADDSIETMLMNLVRGTGLRGLTGIAPRNTHVVRPLLCCSRLELEEYIRIHGLDHVEDSSNASSDYRRNKIRNEVLPLLETINPSVRQTLYDSLQRFSGTLTIYQQAIDKIVTDVVSTSGDIVKLDIQRIKQQADVSTVLYELLSQYNFSPEVIAQVGAALDAASGKMFFSPTHRLIKDRTHLIITGQVAASSDEIMISSDDTEIFVPFKLTVKKFNRKDNFCFSRERNRIHVDASKISYPLSVRLWREGDTFCPFGMNQRKKVSDFFIDNKLSLAEKEQIRLLLSGNEIVWIIGMRADNRFRITDETNEIVEFEAFGL